MQLYYFRGASPNFGDEINSIFWEKYWPGYESAEVANWLVGIGSILTGDLNNLLGSKLVAGSGYWPVGSGKPNVDELSIGFVRGFLTCEALGLPVRYALGDPAILFAQEHQRAAGCSTGIALMPHAVTCSLFDCAMLAEASGMHLIDPRAPVPEVLEKIGRSEKLLTEAMHGAIVADSMGVPWMRVSLFDRASKSAGCVDFKWMDWGSVIGSETAPQVECLLPWPRKGKFLGSFMKPFNRVALAFAARALKRASRNGRFFLSKRQRISSVSGRIAERIQEFVESERTWV